jgi:hypothetical protein
VEWGTNFDFVLPAFVDQSINFLSLVEMKIPDCVIWALTRRNNANLVKFNGNDWSSNPLSVTGFHNASNTSSTVSVHSSKKHSEKKFKRTFSLIARHKLTHGAKKARSAKSQAGVLVSTSNITKNVNLAAKAIQGNDSLNQKRKNAVLRRLARANAAARQHV